MYMTLEITSWIITMKLRRSIVINKNQNTKPSIFVITTLTSFYIKNRNMIQISRPFPSPLHSILENVFSISSRTLWNVRMVNSISSLVDQFLNIVIQFHALSPVFVNCNSNSSVTVAEHETAKTISFIGIHFRQSFNQIRLPDVKAR